MQSPPVRILQMDSVTLCYRSVFVHYFFANGVDFISTIENSLQD